MHTADWWWTMQEKLPPVATIVPIICSSDITHLTNFSGDKKSWPIYLTIGNIPGNIRSKPSNKAHLLLALLPIPPKVIGDAASKGRLRAWATETLRTVLSVVLEPLLHFDLLDGYLRAFHRTKDIFRKYRANRETERLVAERRKELREEYNAELAALEESSTQRRRVIASQRLNFQTETDDILWEESDFNFT
ncbi:hypothetical protein DFP73DRAFT_599051 [Morchella snyderi]|nr:hypothetical protein DFP73DRAFT_599051 [Morchella snyderi]